VVSACELLVDLRGDLERTFVGGSEPVPVITENSGRPPEARFDQLILAEAGVLTGSLMSRGLTGIEDETLPNGSLPRKPHPMDETAYSWGRKTQQQAELRREQRTYQMWCGEGPPKQRAFRIDGADRPPEEWKRCDRSPVYRRLVGCGASFARAKCVRDFS
jgi:hypothetical protein